MTDFWKNKKIFAYIALSHHTRFMIPVMEELAAMGASVKYIVGQAERSQEITAIEKQLPYAHIFDYIRVKDRDEILNNYRRLHDTMATSLKKDYILGIQPVTVIDKTLLASAMEYVGFKNLVKKEKPDLCFALHELNRWGKIFAFWAKKSNVPFITLQEGLAYNLDFGYTGHAQYSSLNLVWGDRVKNKLVSFEAPSSKIIPCGNTHLAREIQNQKSADIRTKSRKKYKITRKFAALLILSARLPVPDLFFKIFQAAHKGKDLHIFVKFHPACKKDQMEKWIGAVQKKYTKNTVFIHNEESTYDLISMADLVVLGQKSTTGMEAIAFGKPLVKLDFAYTPNAPYSFVDMGVALKMRAEKLAEELKGERKFHTDPEKVTAFLHRELKNPDSAIQRVCDVFKNAILSNRAQNRPLKDAAPSLTKQWSILVQVPRNAQLLLAQLEAIHFNSMDSGSYDISFILPDAVSGEVQEILDSLEGDITFTHTCDHPSRIHAINAALAKSRGKHLLILNTGLAPLKGWLKHLEQGQKKHAGAQLFGARIADAKGKIAHAGMVVDENNTPVPAYGHLDINFEAALKEREFQMADHFLAVDRHLFLKLGGFTPDAGHYLFMDLCLKAEEIVKNPNPVVILPELQMIFLEQKKEDFKEEDAVYFYGRWNGRLWESEKKRYKEDGISQKDLAHSHMASAMRTALL